MKRLFLTTLMALLFFGCQLNPPNITTYKTYGNNVFIKYMRLDISNPNSSGTIYYTIDGSTPTTSDYQYLSPIWVSETTTIKARVLNGSQDDSTTAIKFVKKFDGTEWNVNCSSLNWSSEPDYIDVSVLGNYKVRCYAGGYISSGVPNYENSRAQVNPDGGHAVLELNQHQIVPIGDSYRGQPGLSLIIEDDISPTVDEYSVFWGGGIYYPRFDVGLMVMSEWTDSFPYCCGITSSETYQDGCWMNVEFFADGNALKERHVLLTTVVDQDLTGQASYASRLTCTKWAHIAEHRDTDEIIATHTEDPYDNTSMRDWGECPDPPPDYGQIDKYVFKVNAYPDSASTSIMVGVRYPYIKYYETETTHYYILNE